MVDHFPEFTTYWISADALKHGVRETEGYITPNGQLTTILLHRDGYCLTFSEGEWHTSKEAAIVAAEAFRDKAIKSLEKRLAKIRAKSYT
jgi:hypothetical protein